MKINKIVLVFLFIITLSFSCTRKFNNMESLESKLISEDTSIYPAKIQEELLAKIKKMEHEISSLNKQTPSHISSTVTYLSYSIGFIAIVFALGTGVIGFLTLSNYKDLENKISKKIIEANKTIDLLLNYKNDIEKLEQSQNKNLDYFEKSMMQFSELFTILSPKNKLDTVSERIAIRKLYNSDPGVRFGGISALFVYGTVVSIPHLCHIIDDKNEVNENISIATLVKREVLSRLKSCA